MCNAAGWRELSLLQYSDQQACVLVHVEVSPSDQRLLLQAEGLQAGHTQEQVGGVPAGSLVVTFASRG